MERVHDMLASHPHPVQDEDGLLADVISSLHTCVLTCTSCADACLAESMVDELRRCIRLNLDCSDVCHATAELLSRQTEPDWSLISQQLRACATACRVCGDECQRHADMHEHCRICAEACRHCEQMCNRMLEAISSGAMA